MPRTPYLVVPEVAVLLIREGKIFLVRRSNTGYEDGKYCFPAGHKEKGETPVQAVIREAKEVGSSRVDLQACKLEYSIVSPK